MDNMTTSFTCRMIQWIGLEGLNRFISKKLSIVFIRYSKHLCHEKYCHQPLYVIVVWKETLPSGDAEIVPLHIYIAAHVSATYTWIILRIESKCGMENISYCRTMGIWLIYPCVASHGSLPMS